MADLTSELTYPITRGKVVGGSSAVNGAIFMRGHRNDFETWRQRGNDKWGFQDVLPAFKKLETDLDFGATEIHGATGPMPVGRISCGELSPSVGCVLSGMHRSRLSLRRGYECTDIHRGRNTAHKYHHGIRQNAAVRYLEPVKTRKNLDIVDQCVVHRIVFSNDRVIGIAGGQNGIQRDILRSENILLCAGGIYPPSC